MRQLFIALLIASNCSIVHAGAAEKIAFSYCPMTHVMGHGRDSVLAVAEDKAKNDCAMKGGIPGCCAKFFGEDTKAERAHVVSVADKLYGPK